MSRFLASRLLGLKPYTPGEQPQDMDYIKLNTNENPFPPSPSVMKVISNAEVDRLRLYPDPENSKIVNALASAFEISANRIMVGNGSDELLAFVFMAYSDQNQNFAFPEISYGFYPVYSELFSNKCERIPLKADYKIDIAAFMNTKNNIILANPNAPTGEAIPLDTIERLIMANRNRLIVIDEAYVDFGAESAIHLTSRFDNLLIIGTLSKSRSLAGARLGYAVGSVSLISDLKKIKYSFNSYNVNRLTEVIAAAAVADSEYFEKNVKTIIKNREFLSKELTALGFEVLDSKANFIFVRNKKISGKDYYLKLKKKGILVRYFDDIKIKDFVRISIGKKSDLEKLIAETKEIIK